MEKFPFLSEVFDSINEGIYILNRQGDYIYCNSAFLKMVGATRDDALGLNAFRLCAGRAGLHQCGGDGL